MANRTVKRGEIWDSGVQVEYIRGDFDLVVFNVIWGSFCTLAVFRKYDFENAASSTL